jgi:hypothetical protein
MIESLAFDQYDKDFSFKEHINDSLDPKKENNVDVVCNVFFKNTTIQKEFFNGIKFLENDLIKSNPDASHNNSVGILFRETKFLVETLRKNNPHINEENLKVFYPNEKIHANIMFSNFKEIGQKLDNELIKIQNQSEINQKKKACLMEIKNIYSQLIEFLKKLPGSNRVETRERDTFVKENFELQNFKLNKNVKELKEMNVGNNKFDFSSLISAVIEFGGLVKKQDQELEGLD